MTVIKTKKKIPTETLRGIIYCSNILSSTAANAVTAVSAPNQHMSCPALSCHHGI